MNDHDHRCKCDPYYLNVGQVQCRVCEKHGIRWCIGSGIFSTYQFETPADWAWNVAWLDQFKVATEQDESRCEGYKRRGWTETGGQRNGDGDAYDYSEVPF